MATTNIDSSNFQSHVLDASISKIIIRNIERPIVKGNLFASTKIDKEIIGRHIKIGRAHV